MQLTRPHAVKTVKYINSHGGTWTVAAQRIPVQNKDDMEAEAVRSLLPYQRRLQCSRLHEQEPDGQWCAVL